MVKFDQEEDKLKFKGTEQEFSLGTNDAAMKNDVWGGEIPISQTTYRNDIEMKVYCSRYGNPYEGELKLSISSSFGIDSSGTDQYSGSYNDLTSLMAKKIEKDEDFAKKYPST